MTDIQQTLVQIVNRVVHIRLTLNRAVDMLLERDTPPGGYRLPALSVYDMERYITHWRFLIPPQPESKAHIIHHVLEGFAFSPAASPQIAAALELDSDAVKTAYQQAFDEDLASRYTDNIPAEEIADTEAAQDVLAELQWQYLKRGEILFTQGESGDYLYSVVDGRLRSVLTLPNGQSVTLEFHSGELVGEQAIMSEIPYTATVTALRDSDLVRMHRDGFERLVQKYPRGMMQLAYQLMTRSQKVSGLTPTAPQPQSIAILPVTAGTDDFAERLMATFQSYQQRQSVVLAPAELDEKMPPEILLNLESLVDDYIFVDWLQAMQNNIDILLLVGDLAYPNWTRRAIEQADHIIIVGRAGEPFEFAPWKAIFDNMEHPELTAERELVMLHDTHDTGPYDTRDWLRQTDNARHHHIALDSDAGFERVVRFILGKAVGFVFGGGGMRGASHLGVIQALKEAGIHADVVGGTSAGAIVAAQYAAGWSVPDMLQRTKDDLLRRDVLFNVTLPYVALNTGYKIANVYRQWFDETLSEDLWTTCFTVSANLTLTHQSTNVYGPLWRNVRYSTSIAGLFPPPPDENGYLHIDGGVYDNTPSDVMRHIVGAGTVIAVDLGFTQREPVSYEYGQWLNGWAVLWRRINPFSDGIKVVNIMDVLMQSNALGSRAATQMQIAASDLVVNPGVVGVGLFDFDAADRLYESGYNRAKELLAGFDLK